MDNNFKVQTIVYVWEDTEHVQSYSNSNSVSLRIRRFVLTNYGEVFEMITQYNGFGVPTITYVPSNSPPLPKSHRP